MATVLSSSYAVTLLSGFVVCGRYEGGHSREMKTLLVPPVDWYEDEAALFIAGFFAE